MTGSARDAFRGFDEKLATALRLRRQFVLSYKREYKNCERKKPESSTHECLLEFTLIAGGFTRRSPANWPRARATARGRELSRKF
jgi:hypothetical protein